MKEYAVITLVVLMGMVLLLVIGSSYIFGSSTNGVIQVSDGSWISHGLGSVPSSIELSILNSSCPNINIIVAEKNNTHFKVKVYGANYNILSNVTATASTWGNNPVNLKLITDGNYSTVTGEGNKTLGSPGTFGVLKFNLNSSYPIQVFGNLNIRRISGDGTVSVIVESSTDDVTYASSGYASITGKTTGTATYPFSSHFIYGQYFQLRFYSTGTSVSSVYGASISEVEAIVLNYIDASAYVSWKAIF